MPYACSERIVQPFEQITDLTDVAEGTIVRVITRLDETCREVRDAARVIGDAELFKKMEEAQIKIKRDSTSLCCIVVAGRYLPVVSSCVRCQPVFLDMTAHAVTIIFVHHPASRAKDVSCTHITQASFLTSPIY